MRSPHLNHARFHDLTFNLHATIMIIATVLWLLIQYQFIPADSFILTRLLTWAVLGLWTCVWLGEWQCQRLRVQLAEQARQIEAFQAALLNDLLDQPVPQQPTDDKKPIHGLPQPHECPVPTMRLLARGSSHVPN